MAAFPKYFLQFSSVNAISPVSPSTLKVIAGLNLCKYSSVFFGRIWDSFRLSIQNNCLFKLVVWVMTAVASSFNRSAREILCTARSSSSVLWPAAVVVNTADRAI